MTPLFKKLNLKDQTERVVLNAPEGFDEELSLLENVTILHSHKAAQKIPFVLIFATKQNQVDKAAKAIVPKLAGAAVVWFAYPKGTSKKYEWEFNRDSGWAVLGEMGLEPVRQVAIDVDWSALRFRRVEYIKTMTRSFAMTLEGKAKAAKK
ncbi:hypothetical protein [Meiothermus sp.]|uniref:hypothetical protein n=1 Tax=Meiothermus sp. TaxID=1955249 RepID=UPI00307DE0F0